MNTTNKSPPGIASIVSTNYIYSLLTQSIYMKYRNIKSQEDAEHLSKELFEKLKGSKLVDVSENKTHPVIAIKPLLEEDNSWTLHFEIPMLTSNFDQHLGTTYSLPIVNTNQNYIPLWKVTGYTETDSEGEFKIVHS